MKSRSVSTAVFVLAATVLPPALHAARPASEIQPPDRRRVVVEKAQRLAQPAAAEPLPADLVTPFNPPNFGRSDGGARNEARPAEVADPAAAGETAQTDQELLAVVAAKIPTTGTIVAPNGKPFLISGRNRIEVGSFFTVVYSGQEYELELVAISRTSFTVRYKGEEFTRPINLRKSP